MPRRKMLLKSFSSTGERRVSRGLENWTPIRVVVHWHIAHSTTSHRDERPLEITHHLGIFAEKILVLELVALLHGHFLQNRIKPIFKFE